MKWRKKTNNVKGEGSPKFIKWKIKGKVVTFSFKFPKGTTIKAETNER